MKKSIIFLAACSIAALALVSCKKDSNPEQKKEPEEKKELVKQWSWSLDWEHRSAKFNELKPATITEDTENGVLQFVHTHPAADYLIGSTREGQIDTTTFCFGQDAAKAYGYFGGLENDYWQIKCENPDIKAGDKVNVKFLVLGDNQALAFWNGAYVIDGGEPVLLPATSQQYIWGKKANTPTWTVDGNCRYILGYGPMPSTAGSYAHLIDETITVDKDVTTSFEFRLIAVGTTFNKASIAWDSATMRSDPLHSMAIVSKGNGYEGEIPAVTVSVIAAE